MFEGLLLSAYCLPVVCICYHQLQGETSLMMTVQGTNRPPWLESHIVHILCSLEATPETESGAQGRGKSTTSEM